MSQREVTHTYRSYLTGFILALILTAIPFALVWTGAMAVGTTLVIIAIAAVVQMLVHMYFFLHLNLRTTPRENLLALAFAAVLIFIMVGGSLWIMFDLHHRMMG
ncbi:cytochrome o ubiquinol oxidase subunit IV [Hoeflea prorocentri]|uniref:Cytochrome bo(3) ubiquinol oxidase subunit 4 n=1 Tax=Hoeflea prorocentri TaxID=1922333 RepID=A0A9X3ZGL7_9HYPH|nr:cytochrome o ubiquinol oxidase subunit IV [Hoeflea prorocentri]MCY6380907.1 cytochrome o ubiquinol oxidase subunit IV [Hoeflea prorocentri]MDA5398707.1 cytochrome o ubiquinol oxidase subunit IV [Hoeflea prorocentri]